MKKAVLLLSLAGCSVYASEKKELTLDHLIAFAAEYEKRPDYDFIDAFAISCMAVNLIEEQSQNNKLLTCSSKSAGLIQQ